MEDTPSYFYESMNLHRRDYATAAFSLKELQWREKSTVESLIGLMVGNPSLVKRCQ